MFGAFLNQSTLQAPFLPKFPLTCPKRTKWKHAWPPKNNKFSWNHGGLPYKHASTHSLSISAYQTTWSLVKRLWAVLLECGLDGRLFLAVRSLNSCSNLCNGGFKSQLFTVDVGHQQMCVLSSILFIVFMNWIDSHSRSNEGVTVGSCRINRTIWYWLRPLNRVFKKHFTSRYGGLLLALYNYNGLVVPGLSFVQFLGSFSLGLFCVLVVFPAALPHIVRLARRLQYQFTRSW